MNRTKTNSIAYQGIPGSYSHVAAQYLFTNSQLLGQSTFQDTFKALESGKADTAILPIENTIIGSINEVYDLLTKYDFHIKQEVTQKINHNLLGHKNSKISDLTRVYSHPKALGQCQDFLQNHGNIAPEVFEDTAAAAAYISLKQNGTEAAIASIQAAAIYNLKILKRDIQSNKHNYTRFVVIKKHNNAKTGNKSTLVFVVSHNPGSLVSCLRPFAAKGLNLTHLESRPVLGKPFSYLFYLDFEHPNNTSVVDQVIKDMKPHTKLIKKLGTYSKGATIK